MAGVVDRMKKGGFCCKDELREYVGEAGFRKLMHLRGRFGCHLSRDDRCVMLPPKSIRQMALQRGCIGFVSIPEPVEAALAWLERAVECGDQERHEHLGRLLVER